jgi:hypothetical protein
MEGKEHEEQGASIYVINLRKPKDTVTWKMYESDRVLRRTRFGKGYGPVLRETMETIFRRWPAHDTGLCQITP